jgi:hypothetical protein
MAQQLLEQVYSARNPEEATLRKDVLANHLKAEIMRSFSWKT